MAVTIIPRIARGRLWFQVSNLLFPTRGAAFQVGGAQ
jgi:hypothetical protein